MFLYKVTPQSLCKYQEKSVYFSKPHLVELYDYNYGNITKAKRIKYLKKPNSKIYPIDLNVGVDTYVPRESAMYRRDIKLSLKYDMTSAAERDGVMEVRVTEEEMHAIYSRRYCQPILFELWKFDCILDKKFSISGNITCKSFVNEAKLNCALQTLLYSEHLIMNKQNFKKKLKFSYKITPQTLKTYEQNEVYFTIPRLVAYYDYNYDKITPAKRIKYFKSLNSGQYPLDLNAGFKTFIRRESVMYSKTIELSLQYDMASAAEDDHGLGNIKKTKVFTRRGTLVHIMNAYYIKPYDNLTIRVSRYNGNIYMVMEELNDPLSELKPANTHHNQFEKLLFTDAPDKPPIIDGPCDENTALLGVHRSNFGKYDIVYSGELQGIDSSEEINDFDDLEALNNCRFVFSKQMWKTLQHDDNKYLQYWLQSYLANVKDVYIGYKSRDGFITEPIQYKITRDMPKNRYWKPSICTGFLYDFLQNVEKRMSSVDCPHTVFVFHFNWEEKNFSYEIFKGKNEKTFISEKYMEYCKK